MIYEHQCLKCGKIIPVKYSITDPKRTILYCPTCKRMRHVKRIISKTSFVLKGGAWAKDGYVRSENENN